VTRTHEGNDESDRAVQLYHERCWKQEIDLESASVLDRFVPTKRMAFQNRSMIVAVASEIQNPEIFSHRLQSLKRGTEM
jgi:hypothetical protein